MENTVAIVTIGGCGGCAPLGFIGKAHGQGDKVPKSTSRKRQTQIVRGQGEAECSAPIGESAETRFQHMTRLNMHSMARSFMFF